MEEREIQWHCQIALFLLIAKSFSLAIFHIQCLAKVSGACCLCLCWSCVQLASQKTHALSKPQSISKYTIKNYVGAQKFTMQTAGDNTTLQEITCSAGIYSLAIATEHCFSRALQLDLCKSCDFLTMENVTFLEKVATALSSDSAFSNIRLFSLKTHG